MNACDRLLIVIPCLNEEQQLSQLLDQFIAENPEATIVVADGGSKDASCSIVTDRARSAANLHLVDNPRRIQAAGVNLAVERYGNGRDWLLRVDAHCDYPRHFARRLVDSAHLRRATSVVVPMLTSGRGAFQIAAAAAQNSVIGTGGSRHRHIGKGAYVDHGHHALMRVREFQRLGGYREDMTANEDAEFDLRLSKGGGRIWLEPAAAITYYPRSGPVSLWLQYYRYGRGRFRTIRLHGAKPKLRQVAPVAAALFAAVTILTPLSWWFAAPAALWLGVTLVAGFVIGIRAGGGPALLAGSAAIIMHLSWGLGFLMEAIRSPLTPVVRKPATLAERK